MITLAPLLRSFIIQSNYSIYIINQQTWYTPTNSKSHNDSYTKAQQNQYRTTSRHLTVVHRRQAVHSRTQKLVKSDVSPDSTLMPSRQFLGENPETYGKQRK